MYKKPGDPAGDAPGYLMSACLHAKIGSGVSPLVTSLAGGVTMAGMARKGLMAVDADAPPPPIPSHPFPSLRPLRPPPLHLPPLCPCPFHWVRVRLAERVLLTLPPPSFFLLHPSPCPSPSGKLIFTYSCLNLLKRDFKKF